jgi:hypothetical protein
MVQGKAPAEWAAPADGGIGRWPITPSPDCFRNECMALKDKVKTALDETRLLILGSQILFGFQLRAVS